VNKINSFEFGRHDEEKQGRISGPRGKSSVGVISKGGGVEFFGFFEDPVDIRTVFTSSSLHV